VSRLSPEKYRDLRAGLKQFGVVEEMPHTATSCRRFARHGHTSGPFITVAMKGEGDEIHPDVITCILRRFDISRDDWQKRK
jgi:hypothetical protein